MAGHTEQTGRAADRQTAVLVSPTLGHLSITALRARTLPRAPRRHAQCAGGLVVADRVVDAIVIVCLGLSERLEAAAALDPAVVYQESQTL